MFRKNSPSGQTGFTLVEVMVAACVMAVTIVAMIQVLVMGSRMLEVARKQTIAMQIIHGQIDQVRLKNWTEIANLSSLLTSYVADVGTASPSDQAAAGFNFGTNLPAISSGFDCRRTIADVRTDLKQITFTVTWKVRTDGTQYRTYSRSGSTYVGKNGLYVTYQRS